MQIERTDEPNNFANAKFIRLYPSGFALVDTELYVVINQYHWKAVRSKTLCYAVRKYQQDGKTIYCRMHRVIAQPKPEEHVHHINGNTFDNRRQNLQNTNPHDHSQMRTNPI